jgi:hypothetical protein
MSTGIEVNFRSLMPAEAYFANVEVAGAAPKLVLIMLGVQEDATVFTLSESGSDLIEYLPADKARAVIEEFNEVRALRHVLNHKGATK